MIYCTECVRTDHYEKKNNKKIYYYTAEEFKEIYSDKLSELQLDMLKSYSSFERKTFMEKYKELKKYNMFKNSKIQVLGQIFR